MARILLFLAVIIAASSAMWFLAKGRPLPDDFAADLIGDAVAGETVFHAAGCASCHAAPGAEGDDMLVLAGGQEFPSPFGTFIAPNITPDPDAGIGGWDLADLVGALSRGVSPEGQHYYPVFPYVAYSKMTLQDIADLRAFLATLPSDATPSQAHDIGFPFSIRRSLFGWKTIYMSRHWVLDAQDDPELERGRYIVEALAHCGECHTPRTVLGGLDKNRWMAGAPNPDGKGRVPNITPAALDWSGEDIAYYLETGFTPDFDSAGGHMAHVITNMAELTPEDRAAVAKYIKALPPIEDPL